MRVTLAQLEAFYWVAQLGSVQQAARQLNIAQPTLSLRLRDLENQIGTALFERVGRGLRPNHEGESLLPRATKILEEIARIHDHGPEEEARGVLRVGVAETFALVCLPTLLRRLRRDQPALRLELLVATSSDLERGVSAHNLDLAFVVNPIGDPRMRLIPLGTQETSWAASPSWGLPPSVSPSDLHQIPIITNPHPSAMYRQIAGWFRTAALEPAQIDLCSSVAVIAHLVSAGVAVGFLPVKMIEAQILAGTVQALPSVPSIGNGSVYATYRSGGETQAVRAVLRAVREVLPALDYLAPD